MRFFSVNVFQTWLELALPFCKTTALRTCETRKLFLIPELPSCLPYVGCESVLAAPLEDPCI